MLRLFRTVWNTRRDRSAVRPAVRRPCVEELEGRALPSTFGPLPPGGAQPVLADLRSDVRQLTRTLGGSASSTVTGDLKALQTDLTTLTKDLAAGSSITQDLATVQAAQAQLVKDLGTGLPPRTQRLVNDLTGDLKSISGDLTQFTNGQTAQLTNVQNDLTKLTGQLGTLSGAAASDLTALEAAVTSLASDLTAGNAITSDVTTVLKDELTLINDLGLPLPAGSQTTLLTLARDVAGLGISSVL